jgi:peptidoglycan hydrolase-like protein with peptidoglycan-binding domain
VVILAAAGCTGATASGARTAADVSATRAPAPPAAPLHVRAVTPSHHLYAHSAVTVRFSAALSSASVTPTITPAIAGTWQTTGNTSTFTPAVDYAPETAYTVTVPGGSLGVAGSSGGRLSKARRVTLHSRTPSVMFAEQILARLKYLPLRTTAPRPQTAAAEADAVYAPPAGHFSWRWQSTPDGLRRLWESGAPNSLLQGAILAFQHQAGLTPDELLGPSTWQALLAADSAHRSDPHPYSYIYADLTSRPQTLTLWRAGGTVLTSPTNGGVAGAPTPDGTYPIYERLSSTTMSGTNPDGSHYSDPGVPWVNYFNGGSAVHGFPRASYGTPQSVGCLELPIPTAERVFGLVNYGTLVTVTG